jgi:hypothetical protein
MSSPSINTGGIVISAASIIPTVDWALGGFHGAVPASTGALVAGLTAMAIHQAYIFVSSKESGMPSIALPPGTQVSYTPPVTVLNTAPPAAPAPTQVVKS